MVPGMQRRPFLVGLGAWAGAAAWPAVAREPAAGDTRLPEFERDFPRSELLERHDAFEVRRHFR